MKKYLICGCLFLAVGCGSTKAISVNTSVPTNPAKPTLSTPPTTTPVIPTAITVLAEPISNANTRITKKFFGTYVTPKNSPVQPEKFTGYHTGVDFETTAAEKDLAVPISAICDGKIVVSGFVNGYGGVIIQKCVISGADVTVLYGHLNLGSLPKIGTIEKKGDKIAILGAAQSHDTDGERKHLHLSIHKGTAIEYRGYVQNKNELASWLDYQELIK
ncbi:MAG: hypothetical protein JWO40_736 [Candidatus Doudnabacteria bacterium]|nr:hypothetical protein [Candidatus Doudnabacteria bacterium]